MKRIKQIAWLGLKIFKQLFQSLKMVSLCKPNECWFDELMLLVLFYHLKVRIFLLSVM